MKNLIYKDNQFYLCDDLDNKKGQTCIVTNYDASPTNMPHQEFNKDKYKEKEKDKDKYHDKTIVIYARPSCPYCIGFVKFLKQNNKNTNFYDNLIYVEVDSESPKKIFSKSNILKNLKTEIGNHSTVPIVFYKGEFIGGADTSQAFFEKLINKNKN